MVKRCAWGTCKTDSRYPEPLIKDGIAVNFHPFPSEKKFKDRRESWIRACCRADDFVCNKSTYICSLHFVEKEGPTQKDILIPFQRQLVEIRFVTCILLWVRILKIIYKIFAMHALTFYCV